MEPVNGSEPVAEDLGELGNGQAAGPAEQPEPEAGRFELEEVEPEPDYQALYAQRELELAEERTARERWERENRVSTATRPVGAAEHRARTLTFREYAERMARASMDEKRRMMEDEKVGRLKLRPD